uniref:C3H1-type domain-containing protein n=1 Tax=Romanomermis culicivorax TaxID=13658 RepID=A0A915K7C9_ROMCU
MQPCRYPIDQLRYQMGRSLLLDHNSYVKSKPTDYQQLSGSCCASRPTPFYLFFIVLGSSCGHPIQAKTRVNKCKRQIFGHDCKFRHDLCHQYDRISNSIGR